MGPTVVPGGSGLSPGTAASAAGRTRSPGPVTYAAQVDGPQEQAPEIGPMITADFPQTMAALIALAGKAQD